MMRRKLQTHSFHILRHVKEVVHSCAFLETGALSAAVLSAFKSTGIADEGKENGSTQPFQGSC